jgi:hypothetical protein
MPIYLYILLHFLGVSVVGDIILEYVTNAYIFKYLNSTAQGSTERLFFGKFQYLVAVTSTTIYPEYLHCLQIIRQP